MAGDAGLHKWKQRVDMRGWIEPENAICQPVEGEIVKKVENWTITPVLMIERRRYYSHSKPGGPLSQDTHTSSGLSIYGLGVGA